MSWRSSFNVLSWRSLRPTTYSNYWCATLLSTPALLYFRYLKQQLKIIEFLCSSGLNPLVRTMSMMWQRLSIFKGERVFPLREGNSCAKDRISQLIPEMKKLFWDWKFNENYSKKPHKGIREDCLTFLSGSKSGHTDTIRYPGITLKTTWSVESPLMRLQ